MTKERFREITAAYASLRVIVAGDFCLDRYLEIDPNRSEVSIETGLEVYNVVSVRSQPGGAGTVLNNLSALGVGEIQTIGFSGDDGEGYELRRALESKRGVSIYRFLTTPLRRTFTYCKPLVQELAGPPRELNRLDSKNWTNTPPGVEVELIENLQALASTADAIVLMEQVDIEESGVITRAFREAVYKEQVRRTHENRPLLTIADSRRGLREFPPLGFKMNAAELKRLTGSDHAFSPDTAREVIAELARRNGQPVFVTFAEKGILGADGLGAVEHVEAFPVKGPIDIVGAGDSVTANLTAALAAGAALREAMELAMAGASIVIHQLGTTGEANAADLENALFA